MPSLLTYVLTYLTFGFGIIHSLSSYLHASGLVFFPAGLIAGSLSTGSRPRPRSRTPTPPPPTAPCSSTVRPSPLETTVRLRLSSASTSVRHGWLTRMHLQCSSSARSAPAATFSARTSRSPSARWTAAESRWSTANLLPRISYLRVPAASIVSA